MPAKILVVVESPTKAKTIKRFLPKDYMVESCMGHVRDLPQSAKDIPLKYKKEKWANLGVDVDHEFEPIYCIPKNKTKIVSTLKEKMEDADELILATDEDREGESISWHLLELLKPKIPVKRMVFHEITKEAIQKALKQFRNIDENLVSAQEARRVLDRLVGYTISPLLWKKVAYGLSAGRVQSVAVRLIAEREFERLKFIKSTYWDLEAQLEKAGSNFASRLLEWQGKRVASGRDFDDETGKLKESADVFQLGEEDAKKILQSIKGKDWTVTSVEEKPVVRKPSPPFITSSLQQEANRKLGLGSRDTMQVAQKLYERGFITYMRTDSTSLSTEAIAAARDCVKSLYGKDYLPGEPRDYSKKKVKGAQEAHEAIRPAGTEFVRPEATGLKGSLLHVYDLIWKRTVASQMADSQQRQVAVRINAGDAEFTSSGQIIDFPGFLRAYVEGHDDPEAALDEREVKLPPLKKGDKVKCLGVQAKDHETKPPARYTEASLVQKLEKEGIGRPSTYASIIGTIQDRGYVRKMGSALAPTFTALVVTELLRKHLPDYVDLKFTSEMEKSLDDIADGELNQKKYLKQVYFGDNGLKTQVERKEKAIKPNESRAVELHGIKGLSFRVGRYGAYVCRTEKTGEEVCASIPDQYPPGDMSTDLANKLIDQKISGADALGKDPATGKPIYVLTGRYGPYVQLGDIGDDEKAEKPKRMALPAGLEPQNVKMDQALFLLSLPRKLGDHPVSTKPISLGIGRFGPYIVHEGDFRSVPKTINFFEVRFSDAIDLLNQPKKQRGRVAPLKELGAHPETGEAIQVFNGRYGPYVKSGKINASLPEDMEPEKITLALAVELLASKMGSKAAAPKAKTPAKVAKAKFVAPKISEAKKPEVAKAKPAKVSKAKTEPKAPVKKKRA